MKFKITLASLTTFLNKVTKLLIPLVVASLLFGIQCSKGTYIRSIARDLGEKLGCGAHMKSLTRISQGKFCISKSKEISHISKDDIISIESAFEDLDSITIIPKDEKKFINGVTIPGLKKRDNIYRVYNKDNTFIGIGEIKRRN